MILDPKHRQSFLDLLRPPPGYRLAAAIGTTYSLELEPLTAALLAFIGEDLDADAPEPDRLAVLHALGRVSRCLRVYVNAGGVPAELGHRRDRLFALYDSVIRQVRLQDASFHPKLWVLKFEPPGAPEHRRSRPLYRLLCSSRNLTRSRCWELGAWVQGYVEENFESPFGASAAKFCQRLVQTRPGDLTGRSPISRMLQELPRVRFEGSREMHESLELLWQWPGQRRTLEAALPDHGDRALLVSPFLGNELVQRLSESFGELTLLSRQEALDGLSDEVASKLDPKRTFVLFSPDDGEEAALGQGLHAKLLLCESSEGRQAFVGSANATASGWGLGRVNGEVMLAMKPGPSIRTAIQELLVSDPKKGVLYRWIQQYERQPVQEDEHVAARERFNQLLRQLAGLRLRAEYDLGQRALTLICANPEAAVLPEGTGCLVAPYLLAGRADGLRPLAALSGGARYEDVGVGELCELAVLRVSCPRWELSHDFLLESQGLLTPALRQERDELLHQQLMQGVDARALLFRLLGLPPPWGRGRSSDGGGGAGAEDGRQRPSLLEELTLERVLEAVAADPDSVDVVESVLRVLERDGRADSELLAFWRNLKTAMAQTGWRRSDG